VSEDIRHFDIAIVGLGFSGSALFRQLSAGLPRPASICLIDASRLSPCGVAYSTARPEHLLNVRAAHMSMDAHKPDDFASWLGGRYQPHEFAPRMVYGDYLKQRFNEAMKAAKEAGHQVQYYHDDIVRMDDRAVLHAASGRRFAASQVVVASGLRFAPRLSGERVVQPWAFDPAQFAGGQGTVVVAGGGLTAVDMIISLLRCGYAGRILCVSPRGHFPLAHGEPGALPPPAIFPPQLRLSALVRGLRRYAAQHGKWQQALDALRPQTSALWQRLPVADQKRALTRYLHWWNIHRHRMAPAIAKELGAAEASGRVVRLRGRCTSAGVGQAELHTPQGQRGVACDWVFDCTGPGYASPFSVDMSALMETGVMKRHASGAGFAADQDYRIAHAPVAVYAMGALLAGQLLETTAVPELRQQAATIAEAIALAIRPA
jgi:uncharacterized NAD(P)/FAD-binding protein YdhS